jgi:hypothetical protein
MKDLIDQVLEQIKKDVASEDLTALEELLMVVPLKNLQAYLPDEVDCFTAHYNDESN